LAHVTVHTDFIYIPDRGHSPFQVVMSVLSWEHSLPVKFEVHSFNIFGAISI